MPYVAPENLNFPLDAIVVPSKCDFCGAKMDVPILQALETPFCSEKCFRGRYGAIQMDSKNE